MGQIRTSSWKHWSTVIMLGWLASLVSWSGGVVRAGEPLVKLPPLVSAAVQWQGLEMPRLREPVQDFVLSPVWETRLPGPRLRSVVQVRPMPEVVTPMWSKTEPFPERPQLLAGPKSYAVVSDSLSGLPLRWLREQPQDETLSAAVLETIWGEYVRRTVEYWRSQPVLVEPAQIPDAGTNWRQARWQERVLELPLPFVPSNRPPTPPLPLIAPGK